METILGNSKKEGKGLEFAKDLALQNVRDLASKLPKFKADLRID